MTSKPERSNELAFLDDILGDRKTQYRNAEWLRSPFEAEIWQCQFSDTIKLEIDFRIKLYNGDFLTDHRHRDLLEIFKCWLCVQTHFDSTGGGLLNADSAKKRVSRTLHIIDFFILNAERMQLAEFGLAAITDNDMRGLLLKLSSSKSVANSIYEWPTRLCKFLKNEIKGMPQEEANALGDRLPILTTEISPVAEQTLQLEANEIFMARAWLWSHGYYKNTTKSGYRFTPSTEMLTNVIFRNTLRGRTNKQIPEEFQLDPIDIYSLEYPPVPIRTNEEDQLSEQRLSYYIGVIRRLGLLAEVNLPISFEPLRCLDPRAVVHALELKPTGRFKTLPQQLVFDSLRNAIDFALEYGDELIDSYLSLAEHAASAGQTCLGYSTKHTISDLLTPKIRALGVKKWTINARSMNGRIGHERQSSQQYFELLRRNEGLWELLRVLYGATQICVGTLMARRIGELSELVAGHCLDQPGTRLVFNNRKSGVDGLREKEARPIPEIAVRMIRQLERLQTGLIKLGLQKQKTNLFRFPSQNKKALITYLSDSQLNESLNIFCDYFETPVNQQGQRYYIRQHQLRRFFAMLFFWGKSFGGMDTLRWFLGHTDIKHLYHYITESTPGEVLRAVKAHYGSEKIITGEPEAGALSALVEQHFGTRDFSVLDSDELDEYIEELMIKGCVVIEPEFFETPDGQSYRVLVKVTPVEHANEY